MLIDVATSYPLVGISSKSLIVIVNVLDDEFNVDRLPNDEVRRNYQRNLSLIDLSKSPPDLYMACLKEYHNASDGDRSKLLNYFTQKRLKNLTESLGEF